MSFLALDVGTTNWKAVIFSETCKPLCAAKRPAVVVSGEDGLPCYDPRQVWGSFLEMLAQLGREYPLSRLQAVSVTSMGEAVVPIDGDGQPAWPIIPWFDTRSIRQAEQVRAAVGAARVFEITGADAGAIFSLPKLLWIRDNHPAVFRKAKKWLQMSDYINYRLCGNFVTDPSMACRTLAFDLNRCAWSEEMLAPFGLSAGLFPEVVPSGSIIGTVGQKTAEETGLPCGLPVVAGGHDHPVASIAGAAFSQNMVFDSSGTAEPFLHISGKNQPLALRPQGQRCSRHPMPDRFINWGGIVSSGVCVDWAIQRFASHHDFTSQQMRQSYDALFAATVSIPAGSQGLLFHPALRGSGAPDWDARSKGALLGLTAEHTSAHILHAVLEGLCYQAKQIIQMHERISGCAIDTIRCMGGGARIRVWQQIKADVTGCTVQVGRVSDATPMGAALLCVHALTKAPLEEIAQALQPEYDRFEPDPRRQSAYEEYESLYRLSRAALEETNHRLDALTRN